MNRLVPVKVCCRAGNRPELIGNLNRGQVVTARSNCSNPYKLLHLDPTVSKDTIKDRMVEEGYYMNPEPWMKDQLDPNPDQENPAWDMLWGFVVGAGPHKTSYKYDLWLFFTQSDHFVLRMYSAITGKFLRDRGIPVTATTPVFVTTSGGPLIHAQRTMDLRSFKTITGLPAASAYLFRHLFTNTLHDMCEAQLIEQESIVLIVIAIREGFI